MLYMFISRHGSTVPHLSSRSTHQAVVHLSSYPSILVSRFRNTHNTYIVAAPTSTRTLTHSLTYTLPTHLMCLVVLPQTCRARVSFHAVSPASVPGPSLGPCQLFPSKTCMDMVGGLSGSHSTRRRSQCLSMGFISR